MVKILADDWHVLTGSYALDALPDPERAEFERHLQHCPSCEAEVRGLRETAARLAVAKALQPPPGMEQRVLAATYRTRQLPPLPTDRLRADRGEVTRLFDRQPGRISRRMTAFAAAASVAAAVALGITQVSTQHRLESTQASDAAITRVVTAPDARIEATRTSAGGSVTVVASTALREAVITSTGMVSPPAGRVYQVWVMSPSGARSAGLMTGRGTLLASVVVPGDRIGITVEPAGGTSKPTTTPVAVLPA
ncbi:MAG: anti-sigma factor domain-containing protein [Streptosporangiaceae bacterium]